MENVSEHVTRCPRCFGRDVRPSRKSGILDSLMGKLRRTPFRCRGCHNRFYIYVLRDKEEAATAAEPAETPETEAPVDESASKPDVAKPAEP